MIPEALGLILSPWAEGINTEGRHSMKKYFINEDWESVTYEDTSLLFLLVVEQSLPAQSYIHQTALSPEELIPMFKQLVDQYKEIQTDELLRIEIISLPNTSQVKNLLKTVTNSNLRARNDEAVEIINMLLGRADCEIICCYTQQALHEKIKTKARKRKKPFDSMSYTTGCIAKNIDFFNNCAGTGDLNASTCGDSDCIFSDCGSSLTEAKRYIKRYYIRPQNIFCSNKAEILQALVKQVGEANCSVYSLKSLDDHDDVHLLKPSDIIYYYDEGILYDKNHVKVMDYDLNVKHEEDRKKFADVDAVSNATFENEYEDRLVESAKESYTCCICGEKFNDFGNNPSPVADTGKCCDACNLKFVIPARLSAWESDDKNEKDG